MLVTASIGGLFAWSYFGGTTPLNHDLVVPLVPGVMAIVGFVVALVGYFTTPLRKLSLSAQINYALIVATLAMLVAQTNGINSAFLSLFVVSLPFGAFFGLSGLAISILVFGGFLVEQYLVTNPTTGQLIALSLLGGLPLIASIILWNRDETSVDETRDDRSYHELASELSQVAGKSEVVINAIGDGVLALDGQGIVQLINPAAQQLLGWGKHDATNLSYKSILKFLDSKNKNVTDANDPVSLALSTNKSQKNDNFSLQTQSGKAFLAGVSVNPVGQLGNGVIVVFRDITTEKSDERQRAEFISTASHEMRTPVASIEGYLGLALNPQTATIDEKARDFITKAHESAQHLGRLFADLLDVSKADDSRLKNDPKVVDIVPFVHDIVEGLTPKAIEKGLRIIYKPIPDDGAVEDPVKRLNPVFYANVDNDHLREITQNLVENAIKYTLKGEVVVDVKGDQEHVVISITDSGIGIPREDQAHLFQKFYRVDNSDTREIGGTGLGLYLCRRLTETIGGRIWVESEYKRGSTFFVEVPRIEHDEAQRLIEQASIEAERQAEQEQERAIQDAAMAHGVEIARVPTAPAFASEPIPDAAPQVAQVAPPVTSPITYIPPAPQATAPPQQPVEPIYQQPTQQYVAPPVQNQPIQQETEPTNTPLSAIEANPNQYLIRRDTSGIVIPPRQQ